MSDEDNRFAEVAKTLESADEAGDSPQSGGPVDDARDDGTGPDGETVAVDAPPFPFRDVTQYPFYARRESWDALDDATPAIESILRERGVADVRDRELHDAVLRVAATNPEAVARAILEARESRD